MFERENRNVMLEILENTDYRDLPSICQSNSVMAEICRSNMGQKIINRKRREYTNLLLKKITDPRQVECFISTISNQNVVDDYYAEKQRFIFRYISQNRQLQDKLIDDLPGMADPQEVQYLRQISSLSGSVRTNLIADILFRFYETDDELVSYLESQIEQEDMQKEYEDVLYQFEADFIYQHPKLLSRFETFLKTDADYKQIR